MPRTIWKYELPVDDRADITMPSGASVLCVQTQNPAPHIWAIVSPANPPEVRRFRTFGTGHPIFGSEDSKLAYVGTYQLSGGQLVFHVFEEIPV